MDIVLLNDGDNDDVLIPPLPLLRPKENLKKTNKSQKKMALQVDGQERAMEGQVRV